MTYTHKYSTKSQIKSGKQTQSLKHTRIEWVKFKNRI